MRVWKEVLVFGLVLVLFAGLVAAQGATDNSGETSEGIGDLNLEDSKEGVRTKTNEALAKEIEIPENLQFVTRIIFGLKSGQVVNLQLLITYIGLWFILVILIRSAVELVPKFGEGVKGWFLAVFITLLIALSGGVRLAAGWIYSTSRFFGWLEGWGIIRLVIALIFLAVLYFVFSKLIKWLKTRAKSEEAERVGEDIGYVSAMGKIARETQRVIR